MFICYIDESGHCGKKFNSEQPVEVLFGVMINLVKLSKAQRQHKEFLDIFAERKINISEFKASDIYRGSNSFSSFEPSIRDQIFKLLLVWGKDRSCRYFLSPIDCKKHFMLKRKNDSMAKLLRYPFEAGGLNICFAIQKFQKSKKNNKGRTFVVFDEQKGHDEHFLKFFENSLNFSDRYTGFQDREGERLNQIIDVPVFSKSHLASVIQLADLGAFIVRKYIELYHYSLEEKFEGEKQKITQYYSQIQERAISQTHMSPNYKKDPLCTYYRAVRPNGWPEN